GLGGIGDQGDEQPIADAVSAGFIVERGNGTLNSRLLIRGDAAVRVVDVDVHRSRGSQVGGPANGLANPGDDPARAIELSEAGPRRARGRTGRVRVCRGTDRVIGVDLVIVRGRG